MSIAFIFVNLCIKNSNNRHIFINYVILLKGDGMEDKKYVGEGLQTSKSKKYKSDNKKKKKFGLAEVACLVVVSIMISFSAGILIVLKLTDTYSQTKLDKNFEEFKKQYQYVVDNYYKEVDTEKLIDGAISGMLKSLDDNYSNFIDKDNSSFNEALQGSYEGVGLEVYSNGKDVIVLTVFANSSAEEAGLKSGDKIIAIDKEKLEGKSTTYFSNYIKKNESKKKFEITYERNNIQKKVTLTKKYLIIPSVSSNIYNRNGKKIGYLYISTFSATTYNQFMTKLSELEKQNINSLIVDLRDNSGGHLSVVTDMLSLMLDDSHLIYQIETKDKKEKYYSKGKKDLTYPVIILQNNGSASASELMISCLQEQLGATVVGTSSYGKGTVQEVVNLSDGNQYKFTTKKWLTSKGKWINDIGVKPNIEIDLNEKYYETEKEEDDNQLQRALEEASK